MRGTELERERVVELGFEGELAQERSTRPRDLPVDRENRGVDFSLPVGEGESLTDGGQLINAACCLRGEEAVIDSKAGSLD